MNSGYLIQGCWLPLILPFHLIAAVWLKEVIGKVRSLCVAKCVGFIPEADIAWVDLLCGRWTGVTQAGGKD